jgi:hypothetical protein
VNNLSPPLNPTTDEASDYEENIFREAAESFPKRGDTLFVETDEAARLDSALYSTGYLAAGDRLAEGLSGLPSEDALVYPILFLYRHHLELELKELISYGLLCLSGFDEATTAKKIDRLKEIHSLKSLWNLLEYHHPDCDKWASAECQGSFRKLLFELDEHDPKGQAARYDTDRKGNATLAHLALVDIPIFKAGVHKISNYLTCIQESFGMESDWREEMDSW